jgi:tetratricopeptide (TPR) repeat protein/tRNA A-37 threonylcarbamoyl transferase component Bud32
MGSTPCPAAEALAAFVAGSLSGVDLEAVAAHVDGCADCLARVQQLDPGFDPLLAAIGRADPADPFAQEPECAQGLARLQALPGPGTPDDTPHSAGAPAGPGPGVPAGVQRYRPLQLHAKGGLGEVHLAEDAELHRRVALKRLQTQHAGHPDSQRRFLREAEITSKLEHPGVVPIHGLVTDEHGQPCYAMRFIEGESLKDAIQRFHDADRQPDRDPGERNLALRQLLGQFVAVCKTMAFVHNRGIIHRDLKPANVMLGRYGETLVVDWGLAKPVARTEEARASGEETLPPTAGSAGPETRPGQVAGTPAYMSPEQASGAVQQLGPASDIYSLGATLYVLLTGKAPYQGGNVLQQVQRGEFAWPRQLKSTVPPALEAICVKAMARKPEERYVTALDLVVDVEHWLADEPVSAYTEGWATRLRRWGRRHRPLVAGLAAAVLVAVLLGGWGWWYLEQQEADRREEVARLEGRDQQAIETALEQAEAFLRQARWPDAEAALAQAAGRLAGGGADDLKQRLRQARDNLRLVNRLDEIRLETATLVEGKPNKRGTRLAYAAAFKEHGLDVLAGDEAEWGRRLAASPVKEQLVAALDYWAWFAIAAAKDAKTGERLLALARRADPDAKRNRFRDPAVLRDRQKLAQLVRQADVKRLSPELLAVVGGRLDQLGGPGVELLERGQRRYPGDFWLNVQLANALQTKKRPRWREAVGYYRAALAARPATFVYTNLGVALAAMRDLDGAIAALKQAIDLDPKLTHAHINLGAALHDKNDLDGAIAAYKKAIAIDPKDAGAHYNLGIALHDKRDLAEAIAEYNKAIVIDPKHVEPYTNLGNALAAQGNLDGAITCYKKAIAIDPNYAKAHTNLGNALTAKKDLAGAIAAYKQAIALDPKYALAHSSLGNALLRKGDLARAIAAYKHALDLTPKNANFHNGLGFALKANRDLDGAIAEFKKAIALDPKFAEAHNNLGNALYAKPDLDGAIDAYKQAIAIDPKFALAHYNLGNALAAQGNLDGAITCYKKAIAIDPRDAEAHTGLGNALYAKQNLDGAMAAYQKAIAIDPKLAPAHSNLGIALAAKRDLDGAIAALKKAIAIDPKLVGAHINLGRALLGKGRFAEARTATRECLQQLSPAHPLRNVVTQQLRQCEQWLKLDAKLPAILEGDQPPADAVEQLGLALLCQHYKKRYTAAARFYTSAFSIDPSLADDLQQQHRYNAACAAALAAAGKGKDAATLKEPERTRLRKQALDWLRDDLAAWTKVAEKKSAPAKAAVRRTLEHWQKDTDLAGVRAKAALAKLPDAERDAWTKLWKDVDALLRRVR